MTETEKHVHLAIEDVAADGKEDHASVLADEEDSSTGKPSEPESPTHVESKKDDIQPIKFMQLFRYADGLDWFCMIVGLVLSLIGGAAFPSTT
ncbi:hypothetical protein HK102_008580, partial [Quaeritorhiza haematococci]